MRKIYFYSPSDCTCNKKVLLRECKRHTARCVAVANACYSVGVPGDGTPLEMGYPSYPRLDWDPPPPVQGWIGTLPHPRLDWYPPVQGWIGTPPCPRLDRDPHSKVGSEPPPP